MSHHKCVNLLHLFELIKVFSYLYTLYGLLKQSFNMKTTKNIIILIILLFFTSNSFAADETIEMLNKLGKESMVYSKKIVRIDVGDTVFLEVNKSRS